MSMQNGLDQVEPTTSAEPIKALGRTALLSGAFSLLPVFAALLWLTISTDSWPVIACAEVAVTAVFFAILIRLKLAYVAVTPVDVVKRRIVLPTVRVERSRVDRVFINRVLRSTSADALPQMLVVDSSGRRLLGLNGLFWSEAAIDSIADALDVQVIVDDEPLSRKCYYAQFPVAQNWYATRLFRIVAVGGAAIALAAGMVGIQGALVG